MQRHLAAAAVLSETSVVPFAALFGQLSSVAATTAATAAAAGDVDFVDRDSDGRRSGAAN